VQAWVGDEADGDANGLALAEIVERGDGTARIGADLDGDAGPARVAGASQGDDELVGLTVEHE